MSEPPVITWDELYSQPNKEGNPFLTTPTKAMLFNLDVPRFKSFKILGNIVNYQVQYNRDYAIKWLVKKLAFLSGVSPSDFCNYLNEVINCTEFADSVHCLIKVESPRIEQSSPVPVIPTASKARKKPTHPKDTI